MVPLPRNSEMVNTRNSAEKGSISPDSFAVLLARFEDRIESLAVSLKDVIAAVKARQSETSSRCHDYEPISIRSEVSADSDGIKGLTAEDGLMFQPWADEIGGGIDAIHGGNDGGIGRIGRIGGVREVPSHQAIHHQVLTQPKLLFLYISEAENQVPYPYEGATFWSPSYAHKDEKKWLHKQLTDQLMAVHSSYGGDY